MQKYYIVKTHKRYTCLFDDEYLLIGYYVQTFKKYTPHLYLKKQNLWIIFPPQKTQNFSLLIKANKENRNYLWWKSKTQNFMYKWLQENNMDKGD